MRQVYIATYRSNTERKAKVFGSSVEDAKKVAYAAYTFVGSMWYPSPLVDDIVEKVELDPDQTMGGSGCQPSVQDENYVPLTAKDVLTVMFNKEND